MNKEKIVEVLIHNIREVLPEMDEYSFQSEDTLSDLGADSVDRAEIINLMLEELSLRIPRVELAGVSNLGELVEVLHGKLQSA
ncbi:acyl carrier protein [Paenibacillus pini]|uniref:Acyl carrier protein n=1 Tax=Paenibacillus pini JCM 16418 TaxID=1236976 RepID=W7YFP9_9BACL|nr:acyl carrier protein [Paenibacillus pini]GAF07302.1 acyl carrier protein [Paenibacillus pini JCM 16418]